MSKEIWCAAGGGRSRLASGPWQWSAKHGGCVGVGDFSLGVPRFWMEREFSDEIWLEDDGETVHRCGVDDALPEDVWWGGYRPIDRSDHRYQDIECTAADAEEITDGRR